MSDVQSLPCDFVFDSLNSEVHVSLSRRWLSWMPRWFPNNNGPEQLGQNGQIEKEMELVNLSSSAGLH